ncbi:MAG: carboxyl transferase domain-containing protein, partial [Desulfatiglandales bacterium]
MAEGQNNLLELFKRRTRHPYRPRASDIMKGLFHDFVALPVPEEGSLVLGKANFNGRLLYVIGQQKPRPEDLRGPEELKRLNYGMLTSDDHSAILDILDILEKEDPEHTALFTIVDTYGADISMYSAQRFQAFFIAHLIKRFLTVPVRTISLILGEGGSGGALAIQVTDIRGQMEDAMYATAPPESMASIIFRDPTRVEDALNILRPTAKELRKLGVIDVVVPSPEKVDDIDGFVSNISRFLERSLKIVFRTGMRKLLKRRSSRAKAYGIQRKIGPLHDIMKYIEKPIRAAFKRPSPDIKIVSYSPMTEVPDDYGAHNGEGHPQDMVHCIGSKETGPDGKKGCSKLVPLKSFLDNYHICPECGYSYVMGASGWIDCLMDGESFHELYHNLTVYDLLDETYITKYYREFLKRQEGRSPFKESLVVGTGRINGFRVAAAICEFHYCGGSMGVVFGEKFRRVVDYAIRERLPLVSVCCSGGARLYEGILALMQMVKTVEAVNRLKEQGLPYISILADPSTGGAIASYAALGDIII